MGDRRRWQGLGDPVAAHHHAVSDAGRRPVRRTSRGRAGGGFGLRPGQRLAVAPLVRPPARGDLVVLARPAGPRDLEVVKRVVGLPAERVRLGAGGLEVDGQAVPEPYLAGGPGAGRGYYVWRGALETSFWR